MKVLVTGGGGFIGSHVVDYLMSLGHSVLVVDNFFSGRDHWAHKELRPQIAIVDICDKTQLHAAFSDFQPEVVFHLAAHHYIPYCDCNPEAAYDLNVCGTLNILHEACRSKVQRLFFASSADVYAPSPRPHLEDDAIGPFTVYGRTKLVGEIICRGVIDWGWKPNLLIGRLFNAVGVRETNPHLVPEIIRQIAQGTSQLHLGNLFPTRDFVDLPTQAQAIVDATFAVQNCETVNICSGTAIRVGDMVNMILAQAGRSIEVVIDPDKVRAAERNNLCGTTYRLSSLIGYVPQPAHAATIQAILDEARAKESPSR
jgi:UDP-glucose 4-epimerase